MLAPTGVLDSPAAQRTGIDLDWAEAHAARLRHAPDFIARLKQLFGEPPSGGAPDADSALYEGFVDNGDRRVAERVRRLGPIDAAAMLGDQHAPFTDERLDELLLHWIGRHAEECLKPVEYEAWQDYRRRRLIDDDELGGITLAHYRARIDQLRSERPDRLELLDQLAEWPREIGLVDDRDAPTWAQ
jgi:exodeoxyribonuclease-1